MRRAHIEGDEDEFADSTPHPAAPHLPPPPPPLVTPKLVPKAAPGPAQQPHLDDHFKDAMRRRRAHLHEDDDARFGSSHHHPALPPAPLPIVSPKVPPKPMGPAPALDKALAQHLQEGMRLRRQHMHEDDDADEWADHMQHPHTLSPRLPAALPPAPPLISPKVLPKPMAPSPVRDKSVERHLAEGLRLRRAHMQEDEDGDEWAGHIPHRQSVGPLRPAALPPPPPARSPKPQLVFAAAPPSQTAMRGSNVVIQKALDSPSAGEAPGQQPQPASASEPGSKKSGTEAEQVRELASEVWLILKRRLAFEAMRMGRH